jgi:hypothetical protein
MGRVLQAALAVEALSLRHDVPPPGGDAFRTGEEIVLAGGPLSGHPESPGGMAIRFASVGLAFSKVLRKRP